MKKRAFWFIFLSSLLVLFMSVTCITTVMNNVVAGDLSAEVKSEAYYLSAALDELKSRGVTSDGLLSRLYELTDTLGKTNRITLVSPDGTVLYDSFTDADTMENHLSRPEIASALANGTGETTRSSDTIGKQTYYFALKAEDGSVVRIANTNTSIIGLLGNATGTLIYITVLAVAVSVILALILSDFIIKPINSLKLSEPFAVKTYPELTPLLQNIDRQNKKIVSQIAELTAQRAEFENITADMSEGIVVFSASGQVLSANKSACKIFSDNVGATYLTFCRDASYINVVEKALAGGACQGITERRGRIYRLSANPVLSETEEGRKYSAVLFVSDITDAEQSERMRREFSANVSHELKTPLTSILGCSEIIANGVAKTEDVPRFASQIHTEAARLLALIEDIIKLSRLDEEDLRVSFEKVELSQLCREIVSELSEKAEKCGVHLSFSGCAEAISGFRPVLHEMIFNLADNAVKYNNNGGFVKISLWDEDGRAVLEVADNGIGIPEESQARVFERFYRVDKSHSRSTGGTGLGLSIVKHGAALHKAELTMNSVLNEGTTVTVKF